MSRLRQRAVYGTSQKPRLSVSVSNRNVTAQIIDDEKSITLAHSSSMAGKVKGSLTDKATYVGDDIAKKAQKAKIKQVVFDRGSKLYHGRVKALATAAREGGLEF